MSQADYNGLRRVVDEAWTRGFTVLNNFARAHMAEVAMAASLGLITTKVDKSTYGRVWRITSKGLRWLNETKELA